LKLRLDRTAKSGASLYEMDSSYALGEINDDEGPGKPDFLNFTVK